MPKKDAGKSIVTAAEKEALGNNTEPMKTDLPPDLDSWQRASFEIWRPEEPGEYIIGSYVKSEQLPDEYKDGKEGDVKTHMVVDQATGMQVSFVGGFAVDRAFESCDIVPGDLVFAQYRGQKDTRGGNRVNTWDVRFKKQ